MTRICRLSIALLVACPAAFCQQFADLAGEVRVPIPEGWQLIVEETDAYPYTFIRSDQPAQLSVFKETIEATDAVENEEQLRSVVEEIIQTAILSLPDAALLSNTGFYETDAAGFVIDFTSFDTTLEVTLQHRLYTVLYRAPDASQVMFTAWGKAPEAVYPGVSEAIRFMQNELSYTGPHEDHVFAENPLQSWPYLLLIVIIAAAIALLARQRSRRRGPERTGP
jgi:hypothetical protein